MPNEYSDAERERIVIHDTKLEHIESAILRLEAKMDAWQQNFVTKEVLAVEFKLRDERIEKLENEKNTNKTTAPLWVGAIFTGMSLIIMIYGLLIK